MPSVLVLQHHVLYADVSDNVLAADSREVRLRTQTHLRHPALVDVQCVQIGVTEVCIELIQSVFRLRRKREYTLEKEVQIRVAAHDSSVESILRERAHSRDIAIFISQNIQPVHIKRVDDDTQRILRESRVQPSPHVALADRNTRHNPPNIKPFGACAAPDFERTVRVNDITQGDVQVCFSEVCMHGSMCMETIQRSACSSSESETFSFTELVQVEINTWCPAFYEFFQSMCRECQLMDIGIYHHGIRVRKSCD